MKSKRDELLNEFREYAAIRKLALERAALEKLTNGFVSTELALLLENLNH